MINGEPRVWIADLKRLDAERETNRGLITLLQQHVGETGVSEGAVDVLKRKLGELTQLQALVRPFAELAKHLDGREFNTLHAILRNGTWIKVTMDDFMALKAATLPATPTERGESHSGDDTDMVQQGGGDGE